FLFILINPSSLPAATEQRIALVIGNSTYSSAPLKNPVNDATDVAATLKSLGFNVILKTNATKREMGSAVEEFGKQLKARDVGLFYYAGHGVQLSGVNYLIPVSAKINEETDIEYEAIDAGRILATMYNAKSRVNIVILDACRDNPYVRSFRSATRGLAIIAKAPMGTIVSYSTSPGDVARDGKDRNSPYTSSLVQYMKEPGLSIEQVFKNVRQKLNRETRGKQIPWELSSLQGDFYFVPGSSKTVTDIIQPGKIVIDNAESATDTLDEETMKLEDEDRKLEKEKVLLEKKKALEDKRQKIEEEKATLEAKKTSTLAMGKRPSVTTAKEIKRDGRFIAYDNGTVLDTRTNLMWAAKDNEAVINWQGAKSYCENYSGGGYTDWRMPTQNEVGGLYDAGKTYQTECLGLFGKFNIHLTELVRLTCHWVWTSETRGAEAAVFGFYDGKLHWIIQSRDSFYGTLRALPVRSDK
ncbi:MAG: caspase family protein, partial [Deltaproteobacteria bacterium]